MRCFIAIDLPQEAKKELAAIQKKLPEAKMNLVALDNIHLTLKFLGELNEKQVDGVIGALKSLKFLKFKAKLSGTGVFPTPSFIRTVWVGVEPKEKLLIIHDALYEALTKVGFVKDKSFENHVTLARVKWIGNKIEFIDKLKKIKVKPIEFSVDKISLKKSTLTKQGPIYEDIRVFGLI